MSHDLSHDPDLVTALEQLGERCPGCGATITVQSTADGHSVDVLHPHPACDEFIEFINALHEATETPRVMQ